MIVRIARTRIVRREGRRRRRQDLFQRSKKSACSCARWQASWYATRAAMLALERCEIETKTQARAEVKRVLTEVAKKLGNTPTICRKSYVHPIVIESFLAGELACGGQKRRSPTERLFRLLGRAFRAARNGNRHALAANGAARG